MSHDRRADPAGSHERPAGLCAGPAHMVMYGNPALRAAFGDVSVGLPAREGILGLPPEAFSLLDAKPVSIDGAELQSVHHDIKPQ